MGVINVLAKGIIQKGLKLYKGRDLLFQSIFMKYNLVARR